MGLGTGISLVVSNVIGVGIFTTTGWLAVEIPNAAAYRVWVLGGVLALAGALCYGELGARLPKAGGEYAFLKETYDPGRFLRRLASFWVDSPRRSPPRPDLQQVFLAADGRAAVRGSGIDPGLVRADCFSGKIVAWRRFLP